MKILSIWTHPGKVEAPYTVCIASASNRVDGACEVQRRVPTDWIIEPVDAIRLRQFQLGFLT